MSVRISANLEEVQAKFGILASTLKKAILTGLAAGSGIVLMVRHAFEQQKSPEGATWPPLTKKYATLKARLFPGRPILYRRGALRATIFGEVQGDTAVIGSPMLYSLIHQFGGRAGRGHKANIPARPFLPTPATAEKEALILANEIVQDSIENAELK